MLHGRFVDAQKNESDARDRSPFEAGAKGNRFQGEGEGERATISRPSVKITLGKNSVARWIGAKVVGSHSGLFEFLLEAVRSVRIPGVFCTQRGMENRRRRRRRQRRIIN